jgi:hypothetical protein
MAELTQQNDLSECSPCHVPCVYHTQPGLLTTFTPLPLCPCSRCRGQRAAAGGAGERPRRAWLTGLPQLHLRVLSEAAVSLCVRWLQGVTTPADLPQLQAMMM